MPSPKNNAQLNEWAGEFGSSYTERNQISPDQRVPAFKTMLDGLQLGRILEVGCNRGHNLISISKAIGGDCELAGVEPNPHALEIARKNFSGAAFIKGNAYELPFRDAWVDLAFTAGVLIHIPPDSLKNAISEIHRVSSKYILCIEYFAENEEEIQYRGRQGLLWKRNFGQIYLDSFPGLKLVKNGYWSAEDGFDRTHWWLLAKG